MNNESSNPELPKEVLLGTPGPLPNLHIDLDPSDPAALLFSSGIKSTDDVPTHVSKTAPQLVKTSDDAPLPNVFKGKQLGHYELIGAIGKGGMATVLKARDILLDRTVAVKVLPPDMAKENENVLRFHQEARSAARLDHENIARVFYCGEDQNLSFIAFEFIEGKNLREILTARTTIPCEETLLYMIQVARGLIHAASRNVVHRDIKPSNIIITPTGLVKLVDMGLARSLGPNEGGLTQSGMTLGTFDYISPEQALEPRDADHRSDIYSLGCTFYHLITGHAVVPEGTAARKLYHHQHVKPTDPRVLIPDLPDGIAMLLDKMMAKLPIDRYQTPEEMLADMENVAISLGIAPRDSQIRALGNHIISPTGRQQSLTYPMALAGIFIILALVFMDSLPNKTPSTEGTWPFKNQRSASNDSLLFPDSGNNKPRENTPINNPALEAKSGLIPKYESEEPTLKELREWLQKNKDARQIEIVLAKDLDLTPENDKQEPGLVINHAQVKIRGKDSVKRPTLKLGYDARSVTTPVAWSALTIDSDDAIIQDVNITIDARSTDTEMHGVTFRGKKALVLRRCEFIQAQAVQSENRQLASLLLDSPENTKPTINIEDCCFLGFEQIVSPLNDTGKPEPVSYRQPDGGGCDAIIKKGNSRIRLNDCVFGPHYSIIHFLGKTDTDNPVAIQHCSIMQGSKSSLIYAGSQSNPQVEMNHSLIAKSPDLLFQTDSDNAVLIRNTMGPNQTKFKGEENRYYKVDSFLTQNSPPFSFNEFLSFQNQLRDNKLGVDETSKLLETSPWKNDQPLKLLEEFHLGQAFMLKDTALELRSPDNISDRLIGAEKFLDFSYISKPLPSITSTKPEASSKPRIVDSTETDDPSKFVFKTLETALASCKGGETILIRHDGDLIIKPLRLDKTAGEITIKPFLGSKPILVSGDTREGITVAMFLINESSLKLEDLEIVSRPILAGLRTPSLATLGKAGSINLKNCSVSFDKSEALQLPTIIGLGVDTNLMMDSMPGTPPAPANSIVIDQCRLRGECNIFRNRTTRNCELQITQSFIAIAGAIIKVESPGTGAVAIAGLQARINKVSAFCEGIPFQITQGKPSTIPILVKLSESLLVQIGAKEFVQLEDPEISQERLKESVQIEGGRNIFGSGDKLLLAKSPLDISKDFSLNLEGWNALFPDSQGIKLTTSIPALGTKSGVFWKTPLNQFRTDETTGVGYSAP